MGLFFELFVETRKDEKRNLKLKEYFLSIGEVNTPIGSYKLLVRDSAYNIGLTVSIQETGHTGLEGPGEKDLATQVGFAFYELLKEAPGFRYAMVGVEAGEWVDGQDILDEQFDQYLPEHGLVINDELELELGAQYVPFSKGYRWIPYKGEQ